MGEDQILQRFEAIVEKVICKGPEGNIVELRLVDIDDKKAGIEFITVKESKFRDQDRVLIAHGSVFYLTIGYKHYDNGSKRRFFELKAMQYAVRDSFDEKEIQDRINILKAKLKPFQ